MASPADRRGCRFAKGSLTSGAALLLAGAVVLLAGCAQHSGIGPSGPKAADLVAKMAAGGVICAPLRPLDHPGSLTVDDAECDVGAVTLDIVTFRGSLTRDAYLMATKSLGGGFLVGDLWVISADDPATLATVQAGIGGSLR